MDVVCKSVSENITKDINKTFDTRRLLYQRMRAVKNFDMANSLSKTFKETIDEIDKKLREIEESNKDVTIYIRHFKEPRIYNEEFDDVEIRAEFYWEVGVSLIPDITGAKLKNSSKSDVRLFADATSSKKYSDSLRKKYPKARCVRFKD